MALSEHEQQVLDEIELQLFLDDPELEQRMGRGPRQLGRLLTAIGIVLVGLGVVLSTFTTGFPVAVFAVVVTMGSLLVLFPSQRTR